MLNFWEKLNKPVFALAPMEEVTDFAFREMFARYGKPDIMFTEFVNVDGLAHPEGRKKLEIDLKFSEAQRPIVAQIWGTDPEKFYRAALLVADLGFDGVDINMGCPQSKEIQIGACAALIRQPELAKEIIEATKRGAMSSSRQIPVSVKTRIGYSKPQIEEWIGLLLQMDLAALTIHGRTKQEMSKVPAHWDEIAKAVELKNKLRSQTIILGNGDVKSREEGWQRIKETGADGVMIARGAFGNPWLFRNDGYSPDIKERFRVMLEHAELFEKIFLGQKNFVIMRKHFKAYCSGFPGAAELRAKLMETKSLEDTKQVVEEYLKTE